MAPALVAAPLVAPASPVESRTRSTLRATASPIAVPYPGDRAEIALRTCLPIGGRRCEHDRVVGEGDEADPDL